MMYIQDNITIALYRFHFD